MHLSKVNETLDHKIIGGSEHQWHCWENARFLDYESDFAYVGIVFNSQTQLVYAVEVSCKKEQFLKEPKPYRWIDPDYKDVYIAEAKERNVDFNQAWDDVKWVDLETEEDLLEKAKAIFNGDEDFDPRVIVPIDLDDETLMRLSRAAHERDITLNQMIEIALQDIIDSHQMETK